MDDKDLTLKDLLEKLEKAQANLDDYLESKEHKERFSVTSKFDKNSGRSYYEIKHKNRLQPIYLVPDPRGYNAWIFKCPQNRLPECLAEGNYTRAAKAIEVAALEMDKMRPTVASKKKSKEEV